MRLHVNVIHTEAHPGHMGGCQNYGPFSGTLNIRGRIIIGTQKRDHNFDNQPYLLKVASWPLSRPSGQRWRISATHNKSHNSNNHNHTSKNSSNYINSCRSKSNNHSNEIAIVIV